MYPNQQPATATVVTDTEALNVIRTTQMWLAAYLFAKHIPLLSAEIDPEPDPYGPFYRTVFTFANVNRAGERAVADYERQECTVNMRAIRKAYHTIRQMAQAQRAQREAAESEGE